MGSNEGDEDEEGRTERDYSVIVRLCAALAVCVGVNDSFHSDIRERNLTLTLKERG